MNENTKHTPTQVNPTLARSLAGVRKRRTTPAGTLPAKLYAPTEGQMALFDPPSEETE